MLKGGVETAKICQGYIAFDLLYFFRLSAVFFFYFFWSSSPFLRISPRFLPWFFAPNFFSRPCKKLFGTSSLAVLF